MCRPTNKKKFHFWTNEEKEYLNEIKNNSHKEIAKLMSEKFNQEYTITQIGAALQRYGLNTNIRSSFPKGNVPWNKGKKGYIGPNRTSFKKGSIPPNLRPVGSERVTVDGYTEVKTENGKWRLKHRLKYIELNGAIPRGYVIIFANGNKQDFSEGNLIAITRNQLRTMNKYKLIRNDIEETKTGTIIADIIIKTQELRKKV